MNSEIACAVADKPTGPYTFYSEVLKGRGSDYFDSNTIHNPHIHKYNCKYYLYYIGASIREEWHETRLTQRIGVAVSDATGLIGQYAHGNEPSHHTVYLYNYAGTPWKTQNMARKVMDNLYSAEPAGLCGNEDMGQMLAWYVFSALGFYPVTPGQSTYVIGSPLYKTVIINLGGYHGNKKFVLKAHNISENNKYIQSATLTQLDFRKPVTLFYQGVQLF